MTAESREFWSQSSQVRAFPAATGALEYEIDLVRDAARSAARSGPVDVAHVIGVGAGRELGGTRAALPDAAIVAWDISEPMVEECREHVARVGMERVEVRCGDLLELGVDDGPADVAVLLNAVLCYLGSEEARHGAMRSLRALVRPGGTVAAVVHQRHGRPDWAVWFEARGLLSRAGAVAGGPGDRVITHGSRSMLFHHYRRAEVEQLLQGAGFDHVEARSLRSWARRHGKRIPLRSPNPLLVVAR